MLDSSTPQTSSALSERDQILSLQEELRRITDARGDFMVGFSHRVRTPLSGVLGMLELLLGCALPEEHRVYADNALAAGRSLMRVCDDLLDYCQAQAGELVLHNEFFSPAQVASDVMGEFAQAAQDKGILLSTSVSPEVPASIEGDPKRLRQVLHVLISNALQHTQAGRVQVGIRTVADGGSPGRLLYWVEDTGTGMDQEQLGELFEFGVESAEHPELAIGLPAARQIVEAMGGEIELESEPGQGTTVRIQLSVAPDWEQFPPDGPHSTSETPAAADEDRRQARILIVEDDLVNQRVTLGYLKLAGHEGFVVDTGEAALKALAEEDYDLVLMDKMMPGMGGLEATRAIRVGGEGLRNPDLPIIALTAEVSVEARRECLESGMNDYLTKPIREGDIVSVIRAWLPPHLRPPLRREAA